MNTPENMNPGPELPGAPSTTPQPGPRVGQPPGPPPPGVAPPPGSYGGFGQRVAQAVGPGQKSPTLACVLSLMPGLGQIYIGYYKLGFIHALVVAGTISLLASESLGYMTPLFGIFLAFFILYNIVDAGRRAAHYNQAMAGVSGFELPPPQMPGIGGSLVGGTVLIVIGFILLTHTAFEFSLAWVEDWWPVAPMLFGAFLIVRELQERAAKSE